MPSNVFRSRLSSPIARARLDDTNFMETARQVYHNTCDEFEEDIRLLRYIKRQFNFFRETRDIKPGLILNHIRVFLNVFQPEDVAVKLMIFRMMTHLDLLKPFLVSMGKWPDKVENIGIGGETIYGTDIPMNDAIIEVLREYRRKQ